MRSKALAVTVVLLLFALAPMFAAAPVLMPDILGNGVPIPLIIWLVPALLAALVAIAWIAGREGPNA